MACPHPFFPNPQSPDLSPSRPVTGKILPTSTSIGILRDP